VPVKFLVPFLEQASLEELGNDKTVLDMWANLLASASHYQSRQVLFIDLLGKLSTADARMIKLIYSRIRKEDWYTETADVDLWDIEECHIISENAAERLERRGDVLLNAFNDKVMICPPSTFDGLIRRACKPGVGREDMLPAYYHIRFIYGDDIVGDWNGALRKDVSLESSMSLVGFKILEKFTSTVRLVDSLDRRKQVRATVMWICLTSLGLDFIRACHVPARKQSWIRKRPIFAH